RFSYVHVFFPLFLLNWGHWGIFLYSDTTGNLLATVFACMVLGVVVRHGSLLPVGAALVAGIGLILLPLCGANGLVLVPLLALWLAYAGIRRIADFRLQILDCRAGNALANRQSAISNLKSAIPGLVILAVAGAAFLVIGLYFFHYGRPTYSRNPEL